MEERSIYAVEEAEDRALLAEAVRAGRRGFAVLMPEDLGGEVEEVFRLAGFRRVEVDRSGWPRRLVVRADGTLHVFEKVEEGVYRYV